MAQIECNSCKKTLYLNKNIPGIEIDPKSVSRVIHGDNEIYCVCPHCSIKNCFLVTQNAPGEGIVLTLVK